MVRGLRKFGERADVGIGPYGVATGLCDTDRRGRRSLQKCVILSEAKNLA